MPILNECITLESGDVIVTETPAGVGYARKPFACLKPKQKSLKIFKWNRKSHQSCDR